VQITNNILFFISMLNILFL